jgi:hypothetical protein
MGVGNDHGGMDSRGFGWVVGVSVVLGRYGGTEFEYPFEVGHLPGWGAMSRGI